MADTIRLSTFQQAELVRRTARDEAFAWLRRVQDASPVHLLPCTIERTGAAPVSKFFAPRATESTSEGCAVLEATLRGRLLRGVHHTLPEGFQGAVLCRQPSGAWMAESGFGGFSAWNHDSTPGSADPSARLMQWLRLAATLHAPVDAARVTEAQASEDNS